MLCPNCNHNIEDENVETCTKCNFNLTGQTLNQTLEIEDTISGIFDDADGTSDNEDSSDERLAGDDELQMAEELELVLVDDEEKEKLLAEEKEKNETNQKQEETQVEDQELVIDESYGVEMNDELIEEIESTITINADQAAKMKEEAAAIAAGKQISRKEKKEEIKKEKTEIKETKEKKPEPVMTSAETISLDRPPPGKKRVLIFASAAVIVVLIIAAAAFFLLQGKFDIKTLMASIRSQTAETDTSQSSQNIEYFTVQSEKFHNKPSATAISNELKKKGYPAFIAEDTDSSGNAIFRIRIGKYPTKNKAETVARALYTDEQKLYNVLNFKNDSFTILQFNPRQPLASTLPVKTEPPDLSTPPVTKTPPVNTTPPVTKTPPVKTTPPVTKTPPANTTPPVTKTPPVNTTPPVTKKPPVTPTPPVNTKQPIMPKPSASSRGKYAIHTSSYKRVSNASKEVARFKKMGFDAYYEKTDLKAKGIWYRVKIGHFKTSAEAKAELNRLKSMDSSAQGRVIKHK